MFPNRCSAQSSSLAHPPLPGMDDMQRTPSLRRRHDKLNRRSSARSIRSNEPPTSNQYANCETQNLMHSASASPHNSPRSPATTSNGRLLSRRKQYSKTKVPIISLDDDPTMTSSTQHSVNARSQTLVTRQNSQHSNPSPLSVTTPSAFNLSPQQSGSHGDVDWSQRAMSASPAKCTVNYLHIPLKPGQTTASMDLSGVRQGVGDRPRSLPKGHSQPTPNQSPSQRSIAQSSSPPYSITSGLVQQRSTESHESSVSMPSATSSGSGGMWPQGGQSGGGGGSGVGGGGGGTHNSRFLYIQSRPPDNKLTHQSVSQRRMQSPEMQSLESHSHQRRSSYEMATGKLDPPRGKMKKGTLKSALSMLKNKSDAFFKRKFKTMDESSELGDPVYHLLRCAAAPGHQPSNCKCVCHLEGYDAHEDLMEMASPIGVLFAARQRHTQSGSVKSKLGHSTAPNSSMPCLHPDDEVFSMPDSFESPVLSGRETKKKSTHTAFSLPSILHRHWRRESGNSRNNQSASVGEGGGTTSTSTRSSAKRASKNRVFTFE